MNRLVVFDCDGTLVDSQAPIIRSMEIVFAEYGVEAPSAKAIRRVVGLSLVQAIHSLLPNAESAQHIEMAESYKQAFAKLRTDGLVDEPLYPGIISLIQSLDADGWLLGVATGKSDRGLNFCLERHGIKDRFITLQTADRHPSKPHPAMLHAAIAEAGATPDTTVMIGDTSYDMAMGRAAGAYSIGVSWGYHQSEELLKTGADQVVDDTSALFNLVTNR